jgi:hypothetical protein
MVKSERLRLNGETSMNIGRAFSFTFQDSAWIKKILILAVLFLIPIVGWLIIAGYVLRLLKNVIDGVPNPLPEWDNWGGDFAGGLKVLVVGLLWGIPLWIASAVLQSANSWLFDFIAWLLGVAWGAVQMSALGDLARNGNIADALNARPFKRVIENFNVWLLYIIGAFIFSIFAVIGLVGIIIGIILTLAIAIVATTHLGGQAYRLSEGDSLPAAPRF